jgi:hypothetical protein
MGYLKSTIAGIAGAAATGFAVLAYRVYQSSHSPRVDVHVTDFYFPRWIPHWVADKGIDLWFRVRFNAPLLLMLAAFVTGFCWDYYRASIKAGTPQQ